MTDIVLLITPALLLLTPCLASNQLEYQACPPSCICYKWNDKWAVDCSGITKVPSDIPPNTQSFSITSDKLTHIPRDAFSGLFNLERLDLCCGLRNGKIEIGALELPKLKTIWLTWNEYTNIPDALPRNVTYVELYGNKITHLKTGQLAQYRSLEYLGLSSNHLSSIDHGAFDDLTNLTSLELAYNNFEDSSILAGAFKNLTNLHQLLLKGDHLHHVQRDLPTSIQTLNYVGNHIKTIPSYAFRRLSNLTTLWFWFSQITTLEDNAFYGLANLTILTLTGNQISSTITKDTFNGLTGLEELDLTANNVSRIEPGAFRAFRSIKYLDISGNKMATLAPEVLDTAFMPHLSSLVIEYNPWYCDCHLRWLREKVATFHIEVSDRIVCSGPSRIAGKSWAVLKPSDFVCP